MGNKHRWERKAKFIYEGTRWEKAALAAGVAMDNRLNTTAKGPYGSESESSVFDMQQWLAWFDWEVLKRRGLLSKSSSL
jgi:hypothetical protein